MGNCCWFCFCVFLNSHLCTFYSYPNKQSTTGISAFVLGNWYDWSSSLSWRYYYFLFFSVLVVVRVVFCLLIIELLIYSDWWCWWLVGCWYLCSDSRGRWNSSNWDRLFLRWSNHVIVLSRSKGHPSFPPFPPSAFFPSSLPFVVFCFDFFEFILFACWGRWVVKTIHLSLI